MNSDAKNSDLIQVLTSLKKCKEFFFKKKKNSHTPQEKKKNFLPFYDFFV